jgi:hypothetical protein
MHMWQSVTTAPNIDNAYEKLLEEFDAEPRLLHQNPSDLLGQLVVRLAANPSR